MKNPAAFRVAGWTFLGLVLALALAPHRSPAADSNPPDLISYQGFVTDSDGKPLGETTPKNYDAVFRIYNASQGGDKLWAEQQTITVDRGNFSVMLGQGAAVEIIPRPQFRAIFAGLDASDRYIGVTLKGLAATDVEITPRLRFLPSPYAFLAQRALSVVNSGGVSLVEASASGLAINTSLGVGTTTPSFPLSLGAGLGNTKLAIWDGGPGSAFGFGVQNGQFRIHLNEASDRFSFRNGASGSEIMTLTGDGSLGLGTGSNPKQRLHNTGDYYGRGHLWLFANQGDGQSGTAYVQARDDSANSSISLQLRSKEGNQIRDALHINPAGNVGIRKQSSGPALDVAGTVAADAVTSGTVTASGAVTGQSFAGYGIVPLGGIIMWSGTLAQIPDGWALCNGQVSNTRQTPDLRDRFVVGASNGANPGGTGGTATSFLSVANLPAHTHSVRDAYFIESYNFANNAFVGIDWVESAGSAHYGSGDTDSNNDWLWGRNVTSGSTGSGTGFENRPPFYAIAFIMRVK